MVIYLDARGWVVAATAVNVSETADCLKHKARASACRFAQVHCAQDLIDAASTMNYRKSRPEPT